MLNQSDYLKVLELLRKVILRGDSLLRPENIPMPAAADCSSIIDSYSIGYSCNLLNNAYCFCKIARKKGVNARLILDPRFSDIFITSLPQWEEVEFIGNEMPKNVAMLPSWDPPDFVKVANWDLQCLTNISQAFEFDKMMKLLNGAAVPLVPDEPFSYLLAYTVLPHVELLRNYAGVDILQVSGVHIGVASFSSKPYVTFPYGTDLFTLPFEDSEIGWMQARGFRKASRHIVSGNILRQHMKELGVPESKIDMLPFMMDTEVYAPLPNNPLRKQLREKYKDKVIFLIGARQNWAWKGSDKLWKAIAKIRQKIDNAVFLSVWYGQDASRSAELLKELRLDSSVDKIGVLSKPTLRRYIDAADVCIDQFTHGGLGTFSLEAMSCARPLITYYSPEMHFNFEKEPPLFNAFSVDEIAEQITHCLENRKGLSDSGKSSRDWIIRYHGHQALWQEYDASYRKAVASFRNKQ